MEIPWDPNEGMPRDASFEMGGMGILVTLFGSHSFAMVERAIEVLWFEKVAIGHLR